MKTTIFLLMANSNLQMVVFDLCMLLWYRQLLLPFVCPRCYQYEMINERKRYLKCFKHYPETKYTSKFRYTSSRNPGDFLWLLKLPLRLLIKTSFVLFWSMSIWVSIMTTILMPPLLPDEELVSASSPPLSMQNNKSKKYHFKDTLNVGTIRLVYIIYWRHKQTQMEWRNELARTCWFTSIF